MAGEMLPYLKFYPAETLSDERFSSWNVTERGTWLTLILHAWKNGSIPSDEEALARLVAMKPVEFRRAWAAVGDRFVPHPEESGRLTSRRLEMEREEAQAKSQAGRKGAASRWAKRKPCEPSAVEMRPHSDGNPEAMPAEQSRAEQSNAQIGSATYPAKILGKAETLAGLYPRTAALMSAIGSFAAGWSKDGADRDLVERAIGEQDLAAVAARVEVSYRKTPKSWLGFHLQAIQAPAAGSKTLRSIPEYR